MYPSNIVIRFAFKVFILIFCLSPVAQSNEANIDISEYYKSIELYDNTQAQKFALILKKQALHNRVVIFQLGNSLSLKLRWIALHLDEVGVDYEIQIVEAKTFYDEVMQLNKEFIVGLEQTVSLVKDYLDQLKKNKEDFDRERQAILRAAENLSQYVSEESIHALTEILDRIADIEYKKEEIEHHKLPEAEVVDRLFFDALDGSRFKHLEALEKAAIKAMENPEASSILLEMKNWGLEAALGLEHNSVPGMQSLTYREALQKFQIQPHSIYSIQDMELSTATEKGDSSTELDKLSEQRLMQQVNQMMMQGLDPILQADIYKYYSTSGASNLGLNSVQNYYGKLKSFLNGLKKQTSSLRVIDVQMFFGIRERTQWVTVPRTKAVKKMDFDRSLKRIPPTFVSLYLSMWYGYTYKNIPNFEFTNMAHLTQSLIGDAAMWATVTVLTAYVVANGYWFRSIKETINQGKVLRLTKDKAYALKAAIPMSKVGNFVRGTITNILFVSVASLGTAWTYEHLPATLGLVFSNAFVGMFARSQVDKWISDKTPKKGKDNKVVIRPGQFSEETSGRLDFWWGITFGLSKNLNLLNLNWVSMASFYGLAAFNVAWEIDEKFNQSGVEHFISKNGSKVISPIKKMFYKYKIMRTSLELVNERVINENIPFPDKYNAKYFYSEKDSRKVGRLNIENLNPQVPSNLNFCQSFFKGSSM